MPFRKLEMREGNVGLQPGPGQGKTAEQTLTAWTGGSLAHMFPINS
jgi:hypothetical protein